MVPSALICYRLVQTAHTDRHTGTHGGNKSDRRQTEESDWQQKKGRKKWKNKKRSKSRYHYLDEVRLVMQQYSFGLHMYPWLSSAAVFKLCMYPGDSCCCFWTIPVVHLCAVFSLPLHVCATAPESQDYSLGLFAARSNKTPRPNQQRSSGSWTGHRPNFGLGCRFI